MHRTIFHNPLVSAPLRIVSLVILYLTGWRIDGRLPENSPKCVMIAAPHTSNWDLLYLLMTAFVLRLRVYWMGKQAIFRPPFRGLMMWLGGIPVNREQSTRLVATSVAAIKAADGPLQLVVSPEGTRGRAHRWKTGFYYIALGAEVPIVMAYIDFSHKCGGLGPVFRPTGDVERDMATIKAFYAPFKGRNPDLFQTD